MNRSVTTALCAFADFAVVVVNMFAMVKMFWFYRFIRVVSEVSVCVCVCVCVCACLCVCVFGCVFVHTSVSSGLTLFSCHMYMSVNQLADLHVQLNESFIFIKVIVYKACLWCHAPGIS